MIILGIDPGTASMGYGIIKVEKDGPVLKGHGVIKTSADALMQKRLEVLYSNLIDISKEYKPNIMSIERLFFNTNAKTAMTVGQARGVAMLAAAHSGLEIVEYTALQAKMELTGYGRADKKQMQEAVKKIIGLSVPIKSDDANDGVAMALCHYFKSSK